MLGMPKKVILSDISPMSVSDRSLVRTNHSTRSVIQLTDSGTRVQLGGGRGGGGILVGFLGNVFDFRRKEIMVEKGYTN